MLVGGHWKLENMTLVSIGIIGLADIILRFLLTPEHCASEVNSESLTDTRPAGFLLLVFLPLGALADLL